MLLVELEKSNDELWIADTCPTTATSVMEGQQQPMQGHSTIHNTFLRRAIEAFWHRFLQLRSYKVKIGCSSRTSVC